MSIVLGTLTIDLKANTASFSQGMDKMSHLSAKTATDIKRSLEKIAVAGIAMAAAMVTGTAAAIYSALDAADAMNDLAQATGSTTETLSKLKAGLNDLSTEELSGALKKLNKAQVEAAGGNRELQAAFKLMNVDYEDGNKNIRDGGTVLSELAVSFANVADSGNKAGIAAKLLGKVGADNIPYLNQYGAAQAEINKETEQFGLVLSSSTALLAGETKDNLDRFHRMMEGIGRTLLAATLPALEGLIVKLLLVAKEANIPDLAKSFGDTVATAIRGLGNALEFAATHAHALKITLETLAALKLTSIAIPLVAQLVAGGPGNIGKALNTLTLGFLGLDKAIPILSKFGKGLLATGTDMLFYARTCGIGMTASSYLGGALTVLTSPITITLAAITALGVGMYVFRDSVFEAGGQIYKFLDAYNALAVMLKGHGTVGWDNALIASKGKRLAESKNEQDEANRKFLEEQKVTKALHDKLNPPPPPPHKPEKDAYQEEINKLNLAITTQEHYASVLGGTSDQIQAMESSEKAEGIILSLNTQRTAAMMGELSKGQKETIHFLVATEDAKTALNVFTKGLHEQINAAELSSAQSRNMTAAIALGDDAVRRATIANALLAAGYKKTEEQTEILAQATRDLTRSLHDQAQDAQLENSAKNLSALQDEIVARGVLAKAVDKGVTGQREAELKNKLAPLNKQIGATDSPEVRKALGLEAAALEKVTRAEWEASDARDLQGMSDELAARKLIIAAATQYEEAQRQAALSAKLYTLNREKETSNDPAIQQRIDAITALAQAEWDEADARDAIALRSPIEQYGEQIKGLARAKRAMEDGADGVRNYAQEWVLAAKAQDLGNQVIDDTVGLLLKLGNGADGVHAFFLDMQRSAVTTAQIIYDALHSAFDKIADNLTELVTGGKTSFAAMAKDIGKQMVNSSMKSVMQQGMEGLVKIFPKLGSLNLGELGTQRNPMWVRMAKDAGLDNLQMGGFGKPKGTLGKDAQGNDIPDVRGPIPGPVSGLENILPVLGHSSAGGKLKTIGGIIQSVASVMGGIGAGSGSTPRVPTEVPTGAGIGQIALIPRAGGGQVSPSKAYLVGEHGPEILSGVGGNITNTAASSRMLTGGPSGPTHVYTIDARGSDPVETELRVRKAIMASHNSAVATAVQVQEERYKRVPR